VGGPDPTAPPPLTDTPAPVPDAYRSLYDSLDNDLAAVEDYVASLPSDSAASTLFGAELLVASGNRGQALLGPQTMSVVELSLDRLQEIGVDGVTVQIADPLLAREFPDSEAYLAFYQQVAEQVHRRGILLVVETGPAFPDPQYSNVHYDWSTLSTLEYFDLRREQLNRIARLVGPDYLSIGNEPDTERILTGQNFGLEAYLAYVREVIRDLHDLDGVRLGAGSGSWDDPDYMEAFIRESGLDFVDIHLYPLTNGSTDYVQRAAEWAAMAQGQGKQVIIGETWLYKVRPEELQQGIGYQEALQRDVFSFWQPLDVRFLRAVAGMAQAQGLEYVSFFWSGYFFAYVEADASWLNETAFDLYQELNRRQYVSLQAGVLTESGRAYQELLSGR
jgi:hypothetical protein